MNCVAEKMDFPIGPGEFPGLLGSWRPIPDDQKPKIEQTRHHLGRHQLAR